MASFFRKCSMGIACKDWYKDDYIDLKETAPKEGSAAPNTSPKSPLNVNFEKETGVTLGLGLVPYLANLWLEDPLDRRVVFGINLGVDHFSRSLILDSVANTYELITFNLNPPASLLFSYPSTPSSLFSPLSHTPLMGSQLDIWDLPEDQHDLPFDPEYFLFLRDECHEEDELSFGSDELIPIDSDDLVLSKCCSSEHIVYDGSVDGMQAQMINHLAHEEETTKVTAAGTNPEPATHIYDIDNDCSFMEQPRPFVGGLSATFGVRATRPAPHPKDQYPSHESHDALRLVQEASQHGAE